MANILKQSTGIDVRIGPFVDATDAVSPETGVSLSTADQAELLKANGAATVDISGATWAAVTGADGWYDLTLTTSHTDTVGELVVVVQDASLCLPVHARFQVVEEAIYDALFGASAAGFDANGRVDVASIAGTAQTARDIGASVLLSSGTGAGQVSLSSGTVTVGTNNDKTGYSLTATTGLGNQTANITGTLSGTVGGIAGTITTLDALDTAQDSQHSTTQTAISNLNDPTAAAIADAVLDEALSGHVTAGTLGKAVADIETDATAILADTNELQTNQGDWATATGFSTHSAADVRSEMDSNSTQLAAIVTDTGTTLPATLATIDGIVDDLKSGIIFGAAATGTLSTTQASTNLTGYADDQLIGRIVTWLSGACEGESSDITDYASTGGILTFTALTTAPSNGDTFKIT